MFSTLFLWVGFVGAAPYPKSAEPTTALYAIAEEGRNNAELVCLDSIAGNLARQSPRLFRVAKTTWQQDSGDGNSDWLRDLAAKHGVAVNSSLAGSSVIDIVRHFFESDPQTFVGFVSCSYGDASVSAALTYAAANEGILVAASEKLSSDLEELGIKRISDLRGKSISDVLPDALPTLSDKIFVFQDPSKTQFLGDYAVFARAATMAFGSDSSSQSTLLSHARGPAAAFGWGPENDYVSTLNQYGVYVHASDYNRNLAALSNLRPSMITPASVEPSLHKHARASNSSVHTVSFVMTDGDNLQWTLGNWELDAKYFGSSMRGSVPLGWTFSPSAAFLAPSALQKVVAALSDKDELVAGPSGIGYMFPQSWPSAERGSFASFTFEGMRDAGMRIVNVLGKNDADPDQKAIEPLLKNDDVDGMLYYSWGGGYSGLKGATWWVGGKPVISGRYSLWGNSSTGQMLGVEAMIDILKKQVRDTSSPSGYSVIPVHAWSHSYEDVVNVAAGLQVAGGVDVVLPSELLRRFKANVKPGTQPELRRQSPVFV